MRVGSESSIFSVFVPKAKAGVTADDNISFAPAKKSDGPRMPVKSDEQLVAEFNERLARQAMDWADTDRDGKLTKSEYIDGQTRLNEINERPNDIASSEARWAKIDKSGAGAVDQDQLRESLSEMLPVKIGHLTHSLR